MLASKDGKVIQSFFTEPYIPYVRYESTFEAQSCCYCPETACPRCSFSCDRSDGNRCPIRLTLSRRKQGSLGGAALWFRRQKEPAYVHTIVQYASIVQKKTFCRIDHCSLNFHSIDLYNTARCSQYIPRLIGLVVMTFPLQLRLLER